METPGFDGDDLPRIITLEWVAWRYRDLHRRVRQLEAIDEKYDPAVQQLLLTNLAKEVAAVKRALYGLMFVIVAGSVTFAWTVFALLGHHTP